MSKPQFIGIDLGRSAVKAYARQGDQTFTVLFPSAVAKARNVVFDQLQASAAADTVVHGKEEYWVGQTALVQSMGADPVGRNDDWVSTNDHDVLVAAAIHKLRAEGLDFNPGNAYITLGVPSRVFKERRDLVSAVRRNVAAGLSHEGKTPNVQVHAQPMGVIAKYTLDETGYTQDGRDLEHDSFAVVEIGQFTSDFSAIVKGLPVIEATDSVEGVELIVNHVRAKMRDEGNTLGVVDVQSLIAHPKIRVRGQEVDLRPWIDEAINSLLLPKILGAVKATFNPLLLQTVDAVLVAGGGAPIVIAGLKANQATSHALVVDNPREAVADGFARLSALAFATQEASATA